MKKPVKRKAWAILQPNGTLSTIIHDRKGELKQHCGTGETVVRVEIREIRQ